jgi:hypothetical protein
MDSPLAGLQAPPETTFALVLSLSGPDTLASRNEHFISALRSKIRTVQALNARKALRYLADEDLECVVVADEGINEDENSEVLSSLIAYVNDGGVAVIGCLFPYSTTALSEILVPRFCGGSKIAKKKKIKKITETLSSSPTCSQSF